MAEETQPAPETAAAHYEALATQRQPVLERGREYSALSIPGLLPPNGTGDATNLPEPYQSLVADGVNNLASKLLLTELPPGASFFRFVMNDFIADELASQAQGQEDDAKATFEKGFAKMEQAITKQIAAAGNRAVFFEAFQHLIVAGNGLLHILDDSRAKFHPLDTYVVKRDSEDNLLEVVIKECLSKTALDPRVKAALEQEPQDNDHGEQKTVDVFTWVRRVDSQWKVHQEVCGKLIDGTEGTYPLDSSPFIVLRWSKVSGCDYGRGRCEEYGGDIRSYEGLSKALILFTAAASKIIFLVNPSGTTDKEQLADSESGEYIDGDARDITTAQLEKAQDFQIAKAQADEIKRRLERAFLMSAAVQRDAERVTAEEIRAMIGELEQSLGGVYSVQAEEFQRPLIMCVWRQMERNGKKLPKLPAGSVHPQLVTGVEGLGRSSDLQRLDQFLAGAEQLFGPDALKQVVILPNYLLRRATALGIDLTGLIKTQQQIDAENQASAQQEMAQKLGPAAIKAASDQMTQGAPTPLPGPIPK